MPSKKKKSVEVNINTTIDKELSVGKDTDETNVEIFKNIREKIKKFSPRTENQKKLMDLIDEKEIVLVSGCAGSGKSYVAIAKAIELLSMENSPYKQIIITTPIVEADEKIGMLPGDITSKTDPYTFSIYYIFEKFINKRRLEKLKNRDVIKVIPLAYMRGITFSNSIIVFDEAQNSTPRQCKTILTRIGENSKYIITGDEDQSDRYKNSKDSGLYKMISKLSDMEEIGIIEFTKDDIVRNKIIGKILNRLENI